MSNKNKIFIMIISLISSITILFATICMIDYLSIPLYAQILIGILGGLLFLGNLAVCAVVDYEIGCYECVECGHKFKPKFWAYFMGVHTMTRRLLKCPECKKKSLCKRKLK